MSDTTEIEKSRVMAFAVPAEVASATQVAAQRDFTSVSYVCRRALVDALRQRGLLTSEDR